MKIRTNDDLYHGQPYALVMYHRNIATIGFFPFWKVKAFEDIPLYSEASALLIGLTYADFTPEDSDE